MTSSVVVVIFLVAVVILGGILFAVLVVTRKTTRHLDVTKYRSRWLKIEQVLSRDQPASYQLSVLEADKLLDQALREKGVPGQTMGERMKAFNTRWTNANAVWGAHKLRNQIAHETDVRVSFDDTRRALGGFKQGLKDVGAI